MTPEDRVLDEIKSKLKEIAGQLMQNKRERQELDQAWAEYNLKIADYKRHKEAFEKRVEQWNLAHQ